MDEERIAPHLEEVRPGEIPEVLRVASTLYARDRAEILAAEQRQALLQAAAEAGLPAEYLERAAAAIHGQKAARLQRRRQWRSSALAALALATGLALVSVRREVSYFPPPMPPSPMLEPIPPATVVPAGPYTPVDLSGQVTHSLNEPMLDTPGNDLSDLGTGVKRIAGVPFQPDGVALVGPKQTESDLTHGPVALPEEVTGIPIGQKVRRLYFLQGTHFSAPRGTLIGAYIIHYADGGEEESPIVYGNDVLDWWALPGNGHEAALSHIAWIGNNAAASRFGVGIRLFLQKCTNPNPEREIRSLDLVTGDQRPGANAAAPFLAGLTAEGGIPSPPEDDQPDTPATLG